MPPGSQTPTSPFRRGRNALLRGDGSEIPQAELFSETREMPWICFWLRLCISKLDTYLPPPLDPEQNLLLHRVAHTRSRRPRLSSTRMISWTMDRTVCFSKSTTTSALVGVSYGSSTPVNPLISPPSPSCRCPSGPSSRSTQAASRRAPGRRARTSRPARAPAPAPPRTARWAPR